MKTYSIRDLVPFTLSYICDLVLLVISTYEFRIKCNWHGVNYEVNPKIWGKISLRRFPGSQIKIGKNFYAVCKPGRYSFNIFPQALLRTYSSSAKIKIGDNVGLNSIAIFCRTKSISIGDNCLIGGNCQITDNDGHQVWNQSDRLMSPGIESDEDVEIGRNVFIGLNVLILKGSRIGNNSVIAAGSIVKGLIPANCMAGGIPAKVIKSHN